MNRPAMNIVTRSVVMPHRGDKDWGSVSSPYFFGYLTS